MWLWVDGKLLVDKWRTQSKREWSGTIPLTAGQRYSIKMEYFESAGSATARLLWRGPSVAKQVVPNSALYRPGAQLPPPPANSCPPSPPAPPAPAASAPTPAPVEGKRWSDPATWESGQVPQDGAAVTIPTDKTVVLDRSVTLKSLQIDGTLIFDNRDLELKTDWIMVHGKLQIGTEESPFQNRARIALTDTTPDEEVMNMGDKVLGVMGGTLDLHGERRPGWTRLSATAEKGDSTLTLQNNPDWKVGDRVAIASTDYDPAQDEERTITAVSGNTVTLDRPLRYQHWGTPQTIDGCAVEERAEVALLSRNISIEGEEASSANGFGGQIMVMDMKMSDGMTQPATARVEGVELNRMGQKNVLRRYPLHLHMLGDASNSYLKDSSVHHTFNRCVTVHGTNELAIQRNVCFDHTGHGFFLEDGAEVNNLIEGNLGFGTRTPQEGQRLLPSDESPATFWITNPDNAVRNNVAAGSEGAGFWLAFPEHPTGLSTNANIWPRRTPLNEFSGNVAHSNDGDGLHVDNGPNPDGTTDSTFYDPHTNPTPPPEDQPDSPPVVAKFENFVGYKNRNEAVWLRGANERLVGATLADNGIGATFASEESFLQDSLLVGETANKGTPEPWQVEEGQVGLDGRSLPRYWEPDFPIRGYEFYDGRVGAQNTTFVNFTSNSQRKASGLGVLLEDAFPLHPKNFASGLRFVNANRVYMPDPKPGKDGDNSAVFLDTDGSVTGTAGRMVVINNPFLLNDTCVRRADWNAHVCDAEYASLWVETGDDDPAAIKPLKLRRDDGETQTLMGCCDDSTDAISNLFPNRNYRVAFNGGTPSKASFVLWQGSGRWLRLKIPYPVTPKVTKYGCDLANRNQWNWCKGDASSIEDLNSRTSSTYYYDPQAKMLYLKLVADDTDYEQLEVQPKPSP